MSAPLRPLRIGLVCPYSMETPGGVQNHVLGLAGYLSAQGHRVRVLAPGRPDRGRLLDHGLDESQIDSAGASIPVPYNGSVARVNFGPVSFARVRRWLRAGDFDLLHLHEPVTPSISGWALVAAGTGLPVVATFHTATPRSRTMELAGRLLRSTIDRIDAGIAVSEVARHVVVQHLGRDALVIPNGFDRSAFLVDGPDPNDGPDRGDRPGSPWRNGRSPRIAYLGRLDEPRKGLDVLLAAVPAIRAVHPDAEVIIAGQGRRPLGPDLITPGRIEDRARAELLASVDLFVAPHVARESFGIVLIEAMAAGAAVVASDLVPFAELLGDRLGYLFTTGDPDALARAALVALADDRRPLRQRAVAGTSRYDWSVVGAQILDVYRSVLATGAATDPDPHPAATEPRTIDPGSLGLARQALRLLATRSLDPAARQDLTTGVRRVLDVGSAPAQRSRAAAALSGSLAATDGRRRPGRPGAGRDEGTSLHRAENDQYVRPSSGSPDRRRIPDSRDRSKERA